MTLQPEVLLELLATDVARRGGTAQGSWTVIEHDRGDRVIALGLGDSTPIGEVFWR